MPVGPAEEAVTPPQEPTADLETDLMALGLGELPDDLLEPIAPTRRSMPLRRSLLMPLRTHARISPSC